MSGYDIVKEGVLEKTAPGFQDGRTEDLTLLFDSEAADETWTEFAKRVKSVGKVSGWKVEEWVEGAAGEKVVKDYGRQVVRGVSVPEYA